MKYALDSSGGVLSPENIDSDFSNVSAAPEETVNFGSRGPLYRE